MEVAKKESMWMHRLNEWLVSKSRKREPVGVERLYAGGNPKAILNAAKEFEDSLGIQLHLGE